MGRGKCVEIFQKLMDILSVIEEDGDSENCKPETLNFRFEKKNEDTKARDK